MPSNEISEVFSDYIENDLTLITLIFIDFGILRTKEFQDVPYGFGGYICNVIEFLFSKGAGILPRHRRS